MVVNVGRTEDWEREIGAQIKALRVGRNLDQAELAARANVSIGSVRNIEAGRGSTLRTLIRITRALDRGEWLTELHRTPAVSPMARLRQEQGITTPQRVRKSKRPPGRPKHEE